MMQKNTRSPQCACWLPAHRQGMSTWMMQSMLTSASTEMQQQYADEIMKQQIL